MNKIRIIAELTRIDNMIQEFCKHTEKKFEEDSGEAGPYCYGFLLSLCQSNSETIQSIISELKNEEN